MVAPAGEFDAVVAHFFGEGQEVGEGKVGPLAGEKAVTGLGIIRIGLKGLVRFWLRCGDFSNKFLSMAKTKIH